MARFRTVSLGILKLVLMGLVLVLVGRELLERLDGVGASDVKVDWLYASLALTSVACASALYGVVYSFMQSALTPSLTPPHVAPYLVAFLSPIGKYIPGKIGSLIGAVWVYSRFGVGPGGALAVTLLSAGATFAASSFVVAPYLGAVPTAAEAIPGLRPVVVGVWLLGLVLALPQILLGAISYFKLTLAPSGTRFRVHPKPYLIGVALSAVQILLMGSGLWLSIRSVSNIDLASLYIITAALAISGTIGFFAFFSPGGLGVREGMLLLLLDEVVEDQQLALAVVMLRLVQIVAEIAIAALGAVLWRWARPKPPYSHGSRVPRTR